MVTQKTSCDINFGLDFLNLGTIVLQTQVEMYQSRKFIWLRIYLILSERSVNFNTKQI